ncbi:MAG: hypothetical protein ACKVJU_24990 [Verrucomicrobiales bacterium]
MKRIGSFLAIVGLASVIFNLLGRELMIFAWIGTWGPTVAWAIRIGAIVLGAIMFFMGKSRE